jgi:hypothetical protein
VRTRALRAALVGGLLVVAGCMGRGEIVVRTPPPPPPARVEVIAPQPGPTHVWIAGHWAWDGREYVWRPGHWVAHENPAQVWVPGHWAARSGGYVWIDGYWRLR